MTYDQKSRIKAFLQEQYRSARSAENVGKHWRMLALAAKTADLREVLGQLMRLALAPLGNLTGHLPIGNTGRSDVSAFAHMDIPSDLKAILDNQSK